uniref:Secreted protein n=1 Tax=Macrostomum lignano TaxID=282301 RepID=A0A1I8ITY2_9PLAT
MCQIIRLKCRASLGTAALRTACFTLGDKLIFKLSNFDYKLMNCTRCGINNELFSCSWYFSFNDFFFLFAHLLFAVLYYLFTKILCDGFFSIQMSMVHIKTVE